MPPDLFTLALNSSHRLCNFFQPYNDLLHTLVYLLKVSVILLSPLPAQLDIIFCLLLKLDAIEQLLALSGSCPVVGVCEALWLQIVRFAIL